MKVEPGFRLFLCLLVLATGSVGARQAAGVDENVNAAVLVMLSGLRLINRHL